MTIKFSIPDLTLGQSKRRVSPKPVAAIYIGRSETHFIVAQKRGSSIRFLAAGNLPRDPVLDPLQQLANHFKENRIACQQLLLTLSRSELELTTVTLPPAEDSEIPSLVLAEVEQQVGDGEGTTVADYLISRRDGNRPTEAIAFSLSQKNLDQWIARGKQARLSIVALVPRHVATIGILHRRNLLKSNLSVVMSAYSGEVELVLCRGQTPLFLRTLRITADDPGVLAEQLGLEIQRSVALATTENQAEPPELFFVDGTEDYQSLLDALQERRIGPIQKIDPIATWEFSGNKEEIKHPACEAALAGAMTDYLFEDLYVNLLDPKRPPKPPNPWRSRALVGGVAVSALLGGGYVLRSDVDDLQAQVAEKQQIVNERTKMASKLQEKADDARWVEQWMSDQVFWLEELQSLSSQLPAGQFATIRRLNASSQDQNGIVDLSVQVTQPERVAELENRLRSDRFAVVSKRVSEQGEGEEYPWQFDTRVTFPITPEKSYTYKPTEASPPDATQKSPVNTAASKPISTNSSGAGGTKQ